MNTNSRRAQSVPHLWTHRQPPNIQHEIGSIALDEIMADRINGNLGRMHVSQKILCKSEEFMRIKQGPYTLLAAF
ncbi:MAG: hypothetical protein AAAB20_26940, partial [Rhizobium sp.]|uniref:hypothetical protein n=1 Tax=Rhizobium sp. TaxID=391 RepID=UPI0030F0A3A6